MSSPRIKIQHESGQIIDYVQVLLRVDSFREGTKIPEEISLILDDDVVELNCNGPTQFITCWIPEGNTK